MAEKRDPHNELYKSLISSLLVCVPVFLFSLYIMETKPLWTSPAVMTLVILGLAAANFASVVFIEHWRGHVDSLTLPVILMAVGIVFLVVIAESINRFIHDFGYMWLFPVSIFYLIVSMIAIFKEKIVWLKIHIGLNIIIVFVLSALVATGKIALPF